MRVHVVTLFPELFPGPLAASVLGRGMERGVFSLCLHDIRAHGEGRHRVVDDAPFGGGPGMVMKPGPLAASIEKAQTETAGAENTPIILMDPQGRRLTQAMADELAAQPEIILVCGHYEGVDERIKEQLITDQISIGDYVLTGGELAAMVVIDGARRISDLDYLKKMPHFFLIRIDADVKIRWQRITARRENPDDQKKTLAQFKKDEQSEIEKTSRRLGKLANYSVSNNKEPKDLYIQLDVVIKKIHANQG